MQHEILAEDNLALPRVREQVKVNGIVHPVLLIPAIFPDSIYKLHGGSAVLVGILREVQLSCQIRHRTEFLIHEAVQVDGGAAAFGTEEG